jgi:spoIIIJ-associated protein
VYDDKNERKEFVADDRAQAIASACEFFGVDEDSLEIGGFEAGAVYGLATRTVIVAGLKDRTPPAPGGGGDRGGRGRDRDRGDRGGRSRDDRGGRGGRDRDDRGGRGGRDRGGRDRGGRAERTERTERTETRDDEAREERPAPAEPSVGSVEGEIGEIGEFVLGVIERMDRGPFEIKESAEEGLLAFELSGTAAVDLATNDGRAVDALQLLANQVASQRSEDPPRVVLDIEGDSDAREDRLDTLAQRAAARASDTGRTVALEAMNGSDRRLIHLALKEEDGVVTMSSGEGRYRQVLVVPEGAAEYEEAVRESEAAAQRNAS